MTVLAFGDGLALTPQDDVVDLLRDMLAQAEAGNVKALSLAYVRADGTCGFRWNVGMDGMALLAGTTVLQSALCREFAP